MIYVRYFKKKYVLILKPNFKNSSLSENKTNQCLSRLWIQPNQDVICLKFKILSEHYYSPTEIERIIRKYEQLHAKNFDNLGKIDKFLERDKLLKLTQDETENLNRSITSKKKKLN